MSGSENVIVAITDEKYLDFAKVLFYQLRSLGVKTEFVLLFDGNQELVSGDKLDISVVNISSKLDSLVGIGESRHVSRVTYAKLLIPEVISEKYQRALYLDVDLLILRNPEFLFSRPTKHAISAVPEFHLNGFHLFGDYDVPYFNAGVLGINLEVWRAQEIYSKFLSLLKEQGNLVLQDQDYLNLIFRDNWDLLPQTCNVFVDTPSWNSSFCGLRDPAIIHFNGPLKPWSLRSKNRFFVEWQAVGLRSGFWTIKDLSNFETTGQKFLHGLKQSQHLARVRGMIPLKVKRALVKLLFRF